MTNQPESDKELRQKLASIIYLKDYHEGEMLHTPRINKLVELVAAECQTARIDELEHVDIDYPDPDSAVLVYTQTDKHGMYTESIPLNERLSSLRSASREDV